MRIVVLIGLMIVGVLGILMGVAAFRDTSRPIPSAAPFLMSAFRTNRQIGQVFGVVVAGLGGILLIFATYNLIAGD